MNTRRNDLLKIATLGILLLTGCEEDESLKIVNRPALEIQYGDQNLIDGDSVRIEAPAKASTQPQQVTMTLRNTGVAPLKIFGLEVLGAHTDRVVLGSDVRPTTDAPRILEVGQGGRPGPGLKIHLSVTSSPQDITAQLKVVTNPDPRGKNIHVVDITIDAAQPMLMATPNPVGFHEVKANEHVKRMVNLVNSGSESVKIKGFKLVGDKGFGVDFEGQRWTTESSEGHKGITFQEVIELQAGRSVAVPVYYTAQVDGPASARLIIDSNDPTQPNGLEVALNANGGNGFCPKPVIKVTEGSEVCPQTLLHLVGDGSEASGGTTIAKYEWSVTGPTGVDMVFLPGADVANPTLAANAAGKYAFQLRVTDEHGAVSGKKSCPDAEVVVNVVPCNAIHVELIWDAPGSAYDDEYGAWGENGVDLDLHFTHPSARGYDVDGDLSPDGWFDSHYDTYYMNMTPDWETFGSSDNPSLDLDDTDGGGPENINLNNPTSDRTYKVGVHYWADHGGGRTAATVKIYIHGELVHEAKISGLINCDMWEVAEIEWPSGRVKPIRNALGNHKVGRICSEMTP